MEFIFINNECFSQDISELLSEIFVIFITFKKYSQQTLQKYF